MDDVLRALYQKHANPVGYLPSDFRNICNEVAGSDLSEWFARSIDSTDELDWQTLANWYGIQIGDIVPLAPGESPRDPRGQRLGRTRWIGIGSPDSPASKAGLADTDEILAVDGLRLKSDIESRIQQYEVGDAITLLVSREDKIIELAVTIGSKTMEPNWGLSLYRRQTSEQATNLLTWLTETKQAVDPKVAQKEAAEKKAAEKAAAEKEKLAAKKKAEKKQAAEDLAAAEKALKDRVEKQMKDLRRAKEKEAEKQKAREKRMAEEKAAREKAAKERKAAREKAAEQNRENRDNEGDGDGENDDLTEAQQQRVDAMVQRVLSRYDTNENGRLDKKEITAMEGRVDFINRADHDDNGVITSEELNKTISDSMRKFRSGR